MKNGHFPPSWKITPFGEAVDNLDGHRVPLKLSDREQRSGDFRYYGASGVIDHVDDYIFDGDYLLVAEDGANLLARSTPIAFLASGKFWVNNHAHIVQSNGMVDLRFLQRYLCSIDIKRFVTGSAQPKLSQKNLNRIPIPLPPLSEQKRIADILDKADAIRRKRQEVSERLEVCIPSLFSEMFGFIPTNSKNWPVVPFGEACESRLGKMLDAKQQTGLHLRPYLRNTNVQWNRFDLSGLLEMDFDESARHEFRLQFGDLLVCEGGEVGRAAIWRDETAECYFQKALHRVRPKPDKSVPEYLLHYLWEMARHGGFSSLASQATIAHLTGVKLKQLPLPLPPLDLQKQFAEQLNRIEQAITRLGDASRETDSLFNALVQHAFKGGL